MTQRYISPTNAVGLQTSEVGSIWNFFLRSFLFLSLGLFCFYFWLRCCYSREADSGGMIIFVPDYVCVLDLGMFELSLFTSDGSEQVRTFCVFT